VASRLNDKALALVQEIVENPATKTAAMRRFSRAVRRASEPIQVVGMPRNRIGSTRWIVDNFDVRVEYMTLSTFTAIVEAASNGKMRVVVSGGRAEIQFVSALMDAALSHQQSWRTIRVFSDSGVDWVSWDYVDAVISECAVIWQNRMVRVRQHLRDQGRLYQSTSEQSTAKTVRSGGGDFGAMWRSRVEYQDPGVLGHIDILPHGTRSSRPWGIEIEAVDIDGINTPAGWDLKGDGSLEGVYVGDGEERHDPECSAFGDSSEYDCDYYDNCSASGYTTTGEWTSPILTSFHSRGLQHLCVSLENRETNSSPGVHVHVSASDLTPTQAARVSLFYSLLEPLFETDYQRETRGYCESLTASSVIRNLRDARNYSRNTPTRNQRPGAFYSGGRYVTVNLSALVSHGTIEFRAMGPVYDYEHLTRWAALCRELVNLGASSVTQREVLAVRDAEGLTALLAKYGSETPEPGSSAEAPEMANIDPQREVSPAGLRMQYDDYLLPA
jgi:hypothetical protein